MNDNAVFATSVCDLAKVFYYFLDIFNIWTIQLMQAFPKYCSLWTL